LKKLRYIKNVIGGLFRYSYLLLNLIRKDFALKYRRSFLGVLWSVLNPLLMAAVMSVVFSQVFKFSIDNFPIYFLSGSLIFNYISDATSGSLSSVLGSAGLVKKVYIPKYLFPLEKCLFALLNSLFSFIAILAVMPFLGLFPTFTVLLFWVPFLYSLLFCAGIGMILSAVNVFFRDISHLWAVWSLAWMYLTPLFYPVDMLPDNLIAWEKYNPAYHLVEYARELLLYGTIPNFKANLICTAWAIGALIVGLFVFKMTQDRFILYM